MIIPVRRFADRIQKTSVTVIRHVIKQYRHRRDNRRQNYEHYLVEVTRTKFFDDLDVEVLEKIFHVITLPTD